MEAPPDGASDIRLRSALSAPPPDALAVSSPGPTLAQPAASEPDKPALGSPLPTTFGGPSADERRAALVERARGAWVLGLSAILLALVSPCASVLALVIALPIGVVASTRAREVLGSPDLDPVSELYARTAQILGVATAVWCTAMLLFIAGFVVLYAGMIAMLLQLN